VGPRLQAEVILFRVWSSPLALVLKLAWWFAGMEDCWFNVCHQARVIRCLQRGWQTTGSGFRKCPCKFLRRMFAGILQSRFQMQVAKMPYCYLMHIACCIVVKLHHQSNQSSHSVTSWSSFGLTLYQSVSELWHLKLRIHPPSEVAQLKMAKHSP
jgi:hypothetical protein